MLNATLVKRVDITEELVIFGVRPDAAVKEFLPGQYVALGLTGATPRPEGFPREDSPPDPSKLIKRAYSIGSSPDDSSVLEFYIAIVPTGVLTSRLATLKVGDRLYVAPKITGTFTIEEIPSGSDLMLVSTGTGLAPYISMIRSGKTWKKINRVTILHGVRYPKDLGYREELTQLAGNMPDRFAYHPVVSRDDGTPWSGERGHVQKIFTSEKVKLDSSRQHLFVCGNPAMIEELQLYSESVGFREHSKKQPGNLHLEKYW